MLELRELKGELPVIKQLRLQQVLEAAPGRAAADEVNLDRFHNRIRKVCALVGPALILSAPAQAGPPASIPAEIAALQAQVAAQQSQIATLQSQVAALQSDTSGLGALQAQVATIVNLLRFGGHGNSK